MITVGVPVIAPVEVLNVKPTGNAGLTDQVTAVPPVLVGVQVAMAVPATYVLDAGV